MKKLYNISDLINNTSEKFSIPLYQRNFSWSYLQISQLISDICDSITEKREEYFIGTLVVCNKGDVFEIIDGQQRFTTILLIALALQNELNCKVISNINLSFQARQTVNVTLDRLLQNEQTDENCDNGIIGGYKDAAAALNEYFEKNITKDVFAKYMMNNVKIFINEMPIDTDVNLYFERFNSRGEQLEYHEIIKAELMQRLLCEGESTQTIQRFAKIWDACSEIDTPCIKFFQKKTKGTDADNEREKIFGSDWVGYEPGANSFLYKPKLPEALYQKVLINNENKASLLSALKSDNEATDIEACTTVNDDEQTNYRSIINFNTFLYYALYITEGIEADKIQLDDKKLKDAFRISSRSSNWILNFGKTMLQLKFIFDNYIIRTSRETTETRKDGEWFLQKAYRRDSNDKKKERLYVNTRFDKNSFAKQNKEILMLQSMFAVTFSAYKDTKWLYTALKYLFDNADKLNDNDFGNAFCLFLEKLSKDYFANQKLCDNNYNIDTDKLRYDNGVSIFAFNFTDYVLWRNRNTLKSKYTKINFDKFVFTYRRSIEHWYPQNPNETEGKKTLDNELLHSFANLCLIVASQNSAFGNLYPLAKLENWKNIFNRQSLKLQLMAAKSEQWKCWDDTVREDILKMEIDIVRLLNDFMKA